MTIETEIITYTSRLISFIIVPVAIWIIKLEKRLTKIETILEIKFKKKEEKTGCSKNGF